VRQALQLHQSGRKPEAEALYRQVLARRADHAPALHFLGLLMHQDGRSAEGIALMERSLKASPGNADFMNNFGAVLRDLGQPRQAAEQFRKAVAAKPDNLAARDNLASVERQLGRIEAAAQAYRDTIGRNPFHMPARLGLAETLQEAGDSDGAIVVLREALTIRPKDVDLLTALGVALLEKGDLTGAAEAARAALAANPATGKAWLLLSQVKRQQEADSELAAMAEQHGRSQAGSHQRMQIAFGLGKAFDDLKDYGRAFDYFAEGNAIRRAGFAYDGEKTRADFAMMKAVFGKDFFASHPQVFGAGELTILRTAVAKGFPLNMKGGFPEGIADMPAKAFADAGRDYLDMLNERFPRYRHVTDKMPGNFLFVGFLHMMLPKAKIVHCARNAAATCLSIFKSNFRGETHLYGYDLAELADFHNLYADMMRHWREVLPGVVHDVRYEDFVADQEGQSRALMNYLGLPWDDRVLAFHEADRPVRTASAAQVRQPMYKGSVDLWTRYGDKLRPLIERLK